MRHKRTIKWTLGTLFTSVLLAIGAGVPALATTTPSISTAGNGVVIATEGTAQNLKFYWATNGTATWHAETVAGKNTTYSPPSIVTNGNGVNIVAMGPNNSLKFYWAINGTSTWHAETVAGKNTTYSAPSIDAN